MAAIYCLAEPFAKWEGNDDADAFMPEKGTLFHVADKAAWETAFPDANVTFIEEDMPTSAPSVEMVSPVQVEWYSIDGTQLFEAPSERGVYFRDGRKYIIIEN